MSAPYVDHDGKELTGPVPETCPLCGGETTWGYGLMGGGIGSYYYCSDQAPECPWFVKCQSTKEDE